MRLVDNIFNSMVGKGETAPYVDCDYLESGGGVNAYIDTGVRIGGQGKVEIDDIVVIDGASDNKAWICGAWTAGTIVGYTLRSRFGTFRGRYNDGDYPSSGYFIFGNRYKYVRDKNIITFYNGDDTIFYSVAPTLSINMPHHSLYLLAENEDGVALTSATRRRIGRVQLTDDSGVLVRDYSPKIRVADGVAGMYDAINGTFELSPNGELFNYGYFT